jgi:hypothetical protein
MVVVLTLLPRKPSASATNHRKNYGGLARLTSGDVTHTVILARELKAGPPICSIPYATRVATTSTRCATPSVIPAPDFSTVRASNPWIERGVTFFHDG